LIESHVTERQDEETRGTGDANVHHFHTGGAGLAARRIEEWLWPVGMV